MCDVQKKMGGCCGTNGVNYQVGWQQGVVKKIIGGQRGQLWIISAECRSMRMMGGEEKKKVFFFNDNKSKPACVSPWFIPFTLNRLCMKNCTVYMCGRVCGWAVDVYGG